MQAAEGEIENIRGNINGKPRDSLRSGWLKFVFLTAAVLINNPDCTEMGLKEGNVERNEGEKAADS